MGASGRDSEKETSLTEQLEDVDKYDANVPLGCSPRDAVEIEAPEPKCRNKFRNFRPPKLILKNLTSEVLRSRTTSSMWHTEG